MLTLIQHLGFILSMLGYIGGCGMNAIVVAVVGSKMVGTINMGMNRYKDDTRVELKDLPIRVRLPVHYQMGIFGCPFLIEKGC